MQISCTFDLSLLNRTAGNFERNLAYSTAQAINDTALEAQKRIRAGLRRTFHVRRGDFLDRSIKIFAFANARANRPFAELGIDNKPRLMLSLYETGGVRQPFKGRSVAVPITGQAARPGIGDSVNPSFTFQALNFTRGPVTHAGRAILDARKAKKIRKRKLGGQYYVWRGNQRTFILQHTARAPYGGVFQRVGPGRDDIRLLYSFRKDVQIRKALDFIETTQATHEQLFRDRFVARFYRLGGQ